MGTMMPSSLLSGLLLGVLLVLAGVAAVRWFGGKKSPILSHRENAVEILKKRYARGEIEKDEYEKIRKDIE